MLTGCQYNKIDFKIAQLINNNITEFLDKNFHHYHMPLMKAELNINLGRFRKRLEFNEYYKI